MAFTPAATAATTADTENTDNLAAVLLALETAFNQYVAGASARGDYSMRFTPKGLRRQLPMNAFVTALEAAGYVVTDSDGASGPFEPGSELLVSWGGELVPGYALRIVVPGGSDFATTAAAMLGVLTGAGYGVVDLDDNAGPFVEGTVLKVTAP